MGGLIYHLPPIKVIRKQLLIFRPLFTVRHRAPGPPGRRRGTFGPSRSEHVSVWITRTMAGAAQRSLSTKNDNQGGFCTGTNKHKEKNASSHMLASQTKVFELFSPLFSVTTALSAAFQLENRPATQKVAVNFNELYP